MFEHRQSFPNGRGILEVTHLVQERALQERKSRVEEIKWQPQARVVDILAVAVKLGPDGHRAMGDAREPSLLTPYCSTAVTEGFAAIEDRAQVVQSLRRHIPQDEGV